MNINTMDSQERMLFNIKNEVEKYSQERFDAGKEEALAEITQEYERGRTDGFEEGLSQAEPKEHELLRFAIEKFKEAGIRGVSFEQILLELESEACKYMTVHGLSSKQVKAKL